MVQTLHQKAEALYDLLDGREDLPEDKTEAYDRIDQLVENVRIGRSFSPQIDSVRVWVLRWIERHSA